MTEPAAPQQDPSATAAQPGAPARPNHDAYTRRAGAPPSVFDTRELVLGWCLWLIGVWALLLYSVGWTGPAFRWMVFAGMIGLMGVWPAVRLSQNGGRPGGVGFKRVILTDWLCLNLVFQAVLWPMHIVAQWSVNQTLWVDGAVLSWSLLTGLLIAWGRTFGTGGMRTVAMVACVAVVLAEPALLWLASVARGTPWQDMQDLRLSPVQAIWELTGNPALYAPAQLTDWLAVPLPWGLYVVGIGAASAAGWIVLGLLTPGRSRSSRSNGTGAPA